MPSRHDVFAVILGGDPLTQSCAKPAIPIIAAGSFIAPEAFLFPDNKVEPLGKFPETVN